MFIVIVVTCVERYVLSLWVFFEFGAPSATMLLATDVFRMSVFPRWCHVVIITISLMLGTIVFLFVRSGALLHLSMANLSSGESFSETSCCVVWSCSSPPPSRGPLSPIWLLIDPFAEKRTPADWFHSEQHLFTNTYSSVKTEKQSGLKRPNSSEWVLDVSERDPLKLWDEQIMSFCQLVSLTSSFSWFKFSFSLVMATFMSLRILDC